MKLAYLMTAIILPFALSAAEPQRRGAPGAGAASAGAPAARGRVTAGGTSGDNAGASSSGAAPGGNSPVAARAGVRRGTVQPGGAPAATGTPTQSSTGAATRPSGGVAARAAATSAVSGGAPAATGAKNQAGGKTGTIGGGQTGQRTAQRGAPGGTSGGAAQSGGKSTVSARAAALNTNVSALGPEFETCRDAYQSCMDAFCGMKSDTYRRCICSQKFRSFKDREDAFEEAKRIIQDFNTNLEAVDMSAAEVNAMYEATEGEGAMKKDTSAAAGMLANINGLLSGAKKATPVSKDSSKKDTSATAKVKTGAAAKRSFSIDVGGALSDVWGEDQEDVFAEKPKKQEKTSAEEVEIEAADVDELEGNALYNAVHKQCIAAAATCRTNKAVQSVVVSQYTVLISNDCSAYEKGLQKQQASIENLVREAAATMREARLESFRSQNSADVNECIGKVREEMLKEYACGPDWKRCLDFSGQYINPTDGEPIYSPLLSKLSEVINLYNPNDANNKIFTNKLDGMKNMADAALNTCKQKATQVWDIFKQQALIEIAQAQDRKIESVKNSCIPTITECYDTQTGALNKVSNVVGDEEMSKQVKTSTAALGQRTARAMCSEKVSACASLWAHPGDPKCEFDGQGKITNAGKCGLVELLMFVDTTDDTKINLMCKRGLQEYLNEYCTPEGGKKEETDSDGNTKLCETPNEQGACTDAQKREYQQAQAKLSAESLQKAFPWACHKYPMQGKGSVYEKLVQRAADICIDPRTKKMDESIKRTIQNLMGDLEVKMKSAMRAMCERPTGDNGAAQGIWLDEAGVETEITIVPQWAVDTYGSFENFVAVASPTNQKKEKLTFANGEAGASGDEAVKKMSSTLVSSAASFSSAVLGSVKWADVAENTDMAAKGFGFCMMSTERMLCEQINDLANGAIKPDGPVATYDNAARVCRFERGFSQAMCEILLNGTWNAGTGNCNYVPAR